jgi:hypothetical protein
LGYQVNTKLQGWGIIMTSKKRAEIRMQLNTQKDIEETLLRVKLKEDADADLRLAMLTAFRPGATLRQIHNALNLIEESNA